MCKILQSAQNMRRYVKYLNYVNQDSILFLSEILLTLTLKF